MFSLKAPLVEQIVAKEKITDDDKLFARRKELWDKGAQDLRLILEKLSAPAEPQPA